MTIQMSVKTAIHSRPSTFPRRRVLKVLAGLGVGTAVFRRALAAQVEQAGQITPEMIEQAEWIAGLKLSPEERESAVRGLSSTLGRIERLRAVKLDNSVAPALLFHPAPNRQPSPTTPRVEVSAADKTTTDRPKSDDDLAFLPVARLAALVRSRQVSSVELTKLYLDRLRRYDPVLRCVVTYTDEVALQAGANRPTAKSPPANTAGRCTAFPGARRT